MKHTPEELKVINYLEAHIRFYEGQLAHAEKKGREMVEYYRTKISTLALFKHDMEAFKHRIAGKVDK